MSAGGSGDNQSIIDSTISYLLEKYSVTGTRIGWLMISSIFVDAWDLYAITLFGTAIEKALGASLRSSGWPRQLLKEGLS